MPRTEECDTHTWIANHDFLSGLLVELCGDSDHTIALVVSVQLEPVLLGDDYVPAKENSLLKDLSKPFAFQKLT